MAKKRRTKKQKIKIKQQIAAIQQKPLIENTAEKSNNANSLVIKDWLKTTWVSLIILAVLGAAYWWLNH